MRVTERQTFRFETFEDEVLESAFTERRRADLQSETDTKVPNAFQEAIIKTFARRELCYRVRVTAANELCACLARSFFPSPFLSHGS